MIAQRITAWAGAGVDRATLKVMSRLWLSGGDPSSSEAQERNEHSISIYGSDELTADPLLFYPRPPPAPVVVQPLRSIVGGRVERLRWPSRYRTWDSSYQERFDRFLENQTAHAEFYHHNDPSVPTIICLHSWATGNYWLQRHAFLVERLYHIGLNVVIFMLPFHGPRRPASSWFGGQFFPGTSPQRTNETFGQLVWDVRSIFRYLQENGSRAVGVMGMSLGGYTSALLASVEPRLSFSVPMIPMVSFGDLLWGHGEKHPKRKEAEAAGITLERVREIYSVHSPLYLLPVIPKERLMIIAGRGDRVCAPEHVRELWDHWGGPEIHWFPGSHMAHFGRERTFATLRNFFRRLGL